MILIFILLFTVLVLVYPKVYLYLYMSIHFLVPVLFVNIFGSPEIELDRNRALSGGISFGVGGADITLVSLLYLFLLLLFLVQFLKKDNVKPWKTKLVKYPGLKYIALYAIITAIVLVLQVSFLELPIWKMLKKSQSYLSLPLLIFNFFFIFSKRTDIIKLYKFISVLLIVLLISFFLTNGLDYFIHLRGIDFDNRMRGIIYQGYNGTASYLALILIVLLYQSSNKISWLQKSIYFLLIFITSVSLLFTFTRAVFLALLLIYFINIFLQKKKNNSIIFLIVSFFILFIFWDSIFDIITRGQGSSAFNAEDSVNSTFGHRVQDYWLPSVLYLLDHKFQLLIGTGFAGFNDFLEITTGVNRANHNIFIEQGILLGGIATFFFFLFWYDLLNKTYRIIRKNVRKLAFEKHLFYVLFVVFVSLNSMNVYFPPYIIIIASFTFIGYKSFYYKYITGVLSH